MIRRFTCIDCPRGCLLTVTVDGDKITVDGNGCSKGIDYGRQEISAPMRTLTTTVGTTHPLYPRLPVRLSREILLGDQGKFMEAVRVVRVERDCEPGDVLTENLLDSGVDLIATGALHYGR